MERRTKTRMALALVVLGAVLYALEYPSIFLLISSYNSSFSFIIPQLIGTFAQICLALGWLVFAFVLLPKNRLRRITVIVLEVALATAIIGGFGTISLSSTQLDYQQAIVTVVYLIFAISEILAFFVAYLGLGLMLYSLARAKTA